MKAVVYESYGPPEVLRITEHSVPSPKENEILIKVLAATVTSADCRVRGLNVPRGFALLSRLVFGWSKPRQPILGSEFSGIVTAVGHSVTRFKPGNEVFGFTDARMGCYAEYKCVPQAGPLVLKPTTLSHSEAAALSFGGTTALDFLRRGNLRTGESLLINGAAGNVGNAALQIAKHLGARVTAVCSTSKIDGIRSQGADDIIDYTQEDVLKNGKTYDVILDTVGNLNFARARSSLNSGGRLLAIAADLPEMLKSPLARILSNQRVVVGPATVKREDLETLARMASEGRYRPVIDRTFPMTDIAQAHAYVEKGHKSGSVVITPGTHSLRSV